MNERDATDDVAAATDTASCTLREEWVDRIAIIAAVGVVDMLSAPQLQRAAEAALAQGPTGLIIDFTDVEFLASAGMGVLVAIHDEVPESVTLVVVADGPATSRPLKLVGIADIIALHATRDDALTALRS